jgi:hypothetical protein
VNIEKGNRNLSWTRGGVLLLAEHSPAALFRKMFVLGDTAALQEQIQRLKQRGSILDPLTSEAGPFRKTLGNVNKARPEQYLTSVRGVEQRLQTAC